MDMLSDKWSSLNDVTLQGVLDWIKDDHALHPKIVTGGRNEGHKSTLSVPKYFNLVFGNFQNL